MLLQDLRYAARTLRKSPAFTLVAVSTLARIERRGTSLADYQDWRDQSRSFEGMAPFVDATFTLSGVDAPERLNGEFPAIALRNE